MATKNIISPEREENQQPPATPARRILNQLFTAVSTPFTAIRNQLQPQEVTIRELEAGLNINHSTSTPDVCQVEETRTKKGLLESPKSILFTIEKR